MEKLQHHSITRENVELFALQSLSHTVNVFWIPIVTSEGKPIIVNVQAHPDKRAKFMGTYNHIPVMVVEHVSSELVNRSFAYTSIAAHRVSLITNLTTPTAYMGSIPNPYKATIHDRHVIPLLVQVTHKEKMPHRPKTKQYSLVAKPECRIGSPYLDALSKEFWDNALDVSKGSSWGDLCAAEAEGRISFPVEIPAIYKNVNDVFIPNEVIDLVNENRETV